MTHRLLSTNSWPDLKSMVTAQLRFAVAFRARKERESGGVESGSAALNTPISPLFGAEALLRPASLSSYNP